MTLLLGPPGSGKTTLLLALAGKLDKELKVKKDCVLMLSVYDVILIFEVLLGVT